MRFDREDVDTVMPDRMVTLEYTMAACIFIHGLQSSPNGTKSRFFRDKCPHMLIPHFKGNLEERMRELGCILHGQSGIRLVGSSLGGLMAAIFAMENASRVERLILLAPAINAPSFTPYLPQRLTVPVWIYHGLQDDIISLHEVERIARNVFKQLRFHVMDDDHSLRRTFTAIDWHRLLAWPAVGEAQRFNLRETA